MFSAPSIASLKKAMQTYARQGGTSNIFINDDGLRVTSKTSDETYLSSSLILDRHFQITSARRASHSTKLMVSDGSPDLLTVN
jgi:hypothetical protein